MRGKMDDVTGRVWTWMAMREGYATIQEIMTGIKHYHYDDVLAAVNFWCICKEMCRRESAGWFFYEYAIIDRVDPGESRPHGVSGVKGKGVNRIRSWHGIKKTGPKRKK